MADKTESNPEDGQTAPPAEDQPETVPAETADEHMADVEAGGTGSGFAAMALRLLIIVLVVFGLSLWLVPMAAPYLPTSIAKHIMPGQQVLDERLAALEALTSQTSQKTLADLTSMRAELSELKTRLAGAEERATVAEAAAAAARDEAVASASAATSTSIAEDVVAQAEEAARTAASTAETATAAATEAGKVAAAATRDTASLARQMTSFEARLGTLKSELVSVGENLSALAGEGGGVSSSELAAAFAALKGRVDVLAESAPDLTLFLTKEDAGQLASNEAVQGAMDTLTSNIDSAIAALPDAGVLATATQLTDLGDAVNARFESVGSDLAATREAAQAAAQAAEAAAAASSEAVATVGQAIGLAATEATLAAVTSRFVNGLPFEAELDELARLAGISPDPALSAVATAGAATPTELARGFGPRAQAAIAADYEASAGEGAINRTGAKISALFAGRPKDETEGTDAAAVLSRVEARLDEAALAEALTEAESLSEAAVAALGDWLDALTARVQADAALSALVATLDASQG